MPRTIQSPLSPLPAYKFERFCGSQKELSRFKRACDTATFMEIKEASMGISAARDLYTHLFPNQDEREPWELISARLEDMSNLQSDPAIAVKYGSSRFHAIAALSGAEVVGYSQFTTLPVNDSVIVYWQYGGTADSAFMRKRYGRGGSYRQKGIAGAFYPIRHGIASHDAEELGKGRVLGTIIESEFIGQANDENGIRFTKTRLDIHHRSGMMAMMLDMGCGIWLSAHMQPRLTAESEPIIMQVLYRPLTIEDLDLAAISEMDPGFAKSIMHSFIDNFDREGFAPEDIQSAREIVSTRFELAKRVLLVPPWELPTITEMASNDPLLKAQVEQSHGGMEAHAQRIAEALGASGQ